MSAETPFDSKDYARLLADLLETAKKGALPVDDNEGSVARTLLEAFARELAVCYEQLRRVYQFGYIDSAEGAALDKVVALLGLERRRAGHLEGTVSFQRGQPAPEDIPIPPGTLLAGRGIPLFETVEKGAALLKGGQEAMVKVRAVEAGGNTVEAQGISLMPKPIWGIDTVTNPAPLTLGRHEETDAELRERAVYWLERVNMGTVGAIEQAVRSLGINQVTVLENLSVAGDVTVILGDAEPADKKDTESADKEKAEELLQKVRPAGIRVKVRRADRVYVRIAATLVLREDYSGGERKRLLAELETALQAYIAALKTGEMVRAAKIDAILTGPKEVAKLEERKLNAFMDDPSSRRVDVTARYQDNDDLRFKPTERAILDTGQRPIALSLELLTLEVWVDVTFDQALTETQKAEAAKSLQTQLDTLKPGQTVKYQDLNLQNLVTGKTVQKVMLSHDKDGFTLTLTPADNTEDRLRPRERLRLRHLLPTEQPGHG